MKAFQLLMEAPSTHTCPQSDFGGISVCFNGLSKATDFTLFLHGLKNEWCYCPHSGYILASAIIFFL
jgi:hypothetical protein